MFPQKWWSDRAEQAFLFYIYCKYRLHKYAHYPSIHLEELKKKKISKRTQPIKIAGWSNQCISRQIWRMKWERQEQKNGKKENIPTSSFTVCVSLSASAVSRKRISNQKADVMFKKKERGKSSKRKKIHFDWTSCHVSAVDSQQSQLIEFQMKRSLRILYICLCGCVNGQRRDLWNPGVRERGYRRIGLQGLLSL